jgi:hypothetical protein
LRQIVLANVKVTAEGKVKVLDFGQLHPLPLKEQGCKRDFGKSKTAMAGCMITANRKPKLAFQFGG